jgi:histidine triad (HIT) family protein
MPSLFTRIRLGEIPGFFVAEDENFFAILDKFPVQPGHILVIPKEEYASVLDLPADLYEKLFAFARPLAQKIQKVTGAERIGFLVEGFGIKDHAHLHLIPLTGAGQMDLSNSQEASDEELKKWQQKLQTTL